MLNKKPRVGDILIYKTMFANPDGTFYVNDNYKAREMRVTEFDGNIMHYVWLDTGESSIIIWKHREGMNPFLTLKERD